MLKMRVKNIPKMEQQKSIEGKRFLLFLFSCNTFVEREKVFNFEFKSFFSENKNYLRPFFFHYGWRKLEWRNHELLCIDL